MLTNDVQAFLEEIFNDQIAKEFSDIVFHLDGNGQELIDALFDSDLSGAQLSSFFIHNKFSRPQVEFFTNVRGFILGKKIIPHQYPDRYTFEITDFLIFEEAFKQLNPCPTSGDIAEYTKRSLELILKNAAETTKFVAYGIKESKNILRETSTTATTEARVQIPKEDRLPPENDTEDWQKKLWKVCKAIGRGFKNFLYRLIYPLIHPINTLKGLLQLICHPIDMYYLLKDRLINYVYEDPIAFTTDVILNIVLIATTIAYSVGSSAGGTAGAVVAETVVDSAPVVATSAGVNAAVGVAVTLHGVHRAISITAPMASIPISTASAPVIAAGGVAATIPAATLVAPISSSAAVISAATLPGSSVALGTIGALQENGQREQSLSERIGKILQEENSIELCSQGIRVNLLKEYKLQRFEESGLNEENASVLAEKLNINMFDAHMMVHVSENAKRPLSINMFAGSLVKHESEYKEEDVKEPLLPLTNGLSG